MDPEVWESARSLVPDDCRRAFGVERISDISNGLNLAISTPHGQIPPGFVVAGFDAPSEIVTLLCETFGLQHSVNTKSEELSKGGFKLLGYDVVDVWAQRTALYSTRDFDAALQGEQLTRNEHGLLPTQAAAEAACKLANETSPDAAPFQPVGVWALI